MFRLAGLQKSLMVFRYAHFPGLMNLQTVAVTLTFPPGDKLRAQARSAY